MFARARRYGKLVYMAESVSESSAAILSHLVMREPIKVLQVDDDPSFLKIAKQCLEMQGRFQVETASSVGEAIERMKIGDFDVIVSDFKMPGKDGLEFLKELRERRNSIPFIIFTGKGREEVAIKALNLGADGYFNKIGHPETVYGELAHGICQVVEKIRTEQSLLKSEDKYRRLVENLHEGIWAIDKDSYTTFVNPRMAEILGYSREEMIGKNLFSFTDERGTELAKRLLERRQQGIKEQHDFEFIRKDEKRIYATLETSPITDDDGNYIGAIAGVMDTTERKKAEQEIVVRDKAMASMAIGVAIADCQGIVTYVNPAFLRMWAYDDSLKVLGRPAAELWHSRDKVDEVLKAVETKEVWAGEMEATRKDGSTFLAYASAATVKDETGKPVFRVGSFTDITEHKKAIEQNKRASEEWRKTFDAISDFVFTLDKDQRLVRVNKAFCDFLKKEPEDLRGRYCYEVMHGTDEPLPNCPCKEMSLARKAVTTEIVCPNLDLALLVTVSPLLDDKGEQTGCVHVAKDITEHKRSERELFDERMKLQNIFAASPDAIVLIDMNSNIEECNEGAVKMLGFASKEEVMDKNAIAFLATKDRQRATHSLENTLKDGLTRDVEYTAVSKDGHELPIELSASVVRDVSGRPVGFVAIIRDITERKKAEEEIRSLARFPSENPGPVLRIAKDGIILYANAAAKSLLGELKTEIGQPAPHHWCRLVSDALNSGLRKEIEVEHRGRMFLFILTPVTDIAYVNVYGLDITERREAEEELRESNEQFRSLAEKSPNMIFVNAKGRIVYANRKCEEIMGYKKEEFCSPHFDFLDLIAPEFKDLVKANFATHKKREGLEPYEYAIVTKEGKRLEVMLSTSLVTYHGKKAILGILADITKQKKTENSLKEASERFEVVNEKMGVVGKLTRHDVRNKLSAVVGNIYLAKKTLPSDHKALAYLREIESACGQTVKILDFAATYEMLGVEELTLVGVGKTVDEAVSLLSDLQGVKVINECHGLTVMADPLLRQLFYNLIDNSLKHGENVSQIRVHYEEGKGGLKLFYEDDGVGIPKAVKPKIFVEGSTMGNGLGHGLHLVKKMIEVYGWTIQETGKQGKGAQFTMSIPRIDSAGKTNCQIQTPRQHGKEPETNTEVPNARPQQPSKQTTVTTSDSAARAYGFSQVSVTFARKGKLWSALRIRRF